MVQQPARSFLPLYVALLHRHPNHEAEKDGQHHLCQAHVLTPLGRRLGGLASAGRLAASAGKKQLQCLGMQALIIKISAQSY